MLVVREVTGCLFLAERVVAVGGDGVEVDEESARRFRGAGGPLGVAVEAALDLAVGPCVAGDRRTNDYDGAFGLGFFDVLAQVPAVSVDDFV